MLTTIHIHFGFDTPTTCHQFFVYSNIMKHFNQHKVMVEVQHGFREKRSCESQLLITINDFAKALNDGKQMDTAFDKVHNCKLCLKLSHYSIKGKCLGWIKAFHSGRTQEVILNRKSSEKSNVTSGVSREQFWDLYFSWYISMVCLLLSYHF